MNEYMSDALKRFVNKSLKEEAHLLPKYMEKPVIPRSPVIDALIKQNEIYRTGTGYKTTSVDSDGNISVKTHAMSDVLQSRKEMYDIINQHPDIIRKMPTIVTASQVKEVEMSELLRKAAGNNQMYLGHQAIRDKFLHGKPLTTMTEAEYNEAKIRKASKDATEKPQQVNKDTKDD